MLKHNIAKNIGNFIIETNRKVVGQKRSEWRLLGKLNVRRYSQEQGEGGEEKCEQLTPSAKDIDKDKKGE